MKGEGARPGVRVGKISVMIPLESDKIRQKCSKNIFKDIYVVFSGISGKKETLKQDNFGMFIVRLWMSFSGPENGFGKGLLVGRKEDENGENNE